MYRGGRGLTLDAIYNNVPLEFLAAAGAAALVALLLGNLMGRSGKSQLQAESTTLRSTLERLETDSRDHNRTVSRMRAELGTVANLALHLPHIVRELNRNDLEPSEIPRLIFQLAHALFQPEQILLYGVRTTNGPQGPGRELTLVAHRGLKQVPDALKTVQIGEGKIGWVAQHELDMLSEDWEKLVRTERLQVPANHPTLSPDVIGPLVQHARKGQQLLGVLCIGSPGIRPRDEKLMFQMVTNFGSLALVSAKSMKALKTMANHDGLTGLLNKRCFTGELAANSLVECESKARPFSIFIFDIDHFKNYNDTNGHPAGDALLKRMAGLIKQQVRPGDMACRYGGEEFVVAMPDTDRDAALDLADKMREMIATTDFEHREKQPLGYVSISGGVASFPKDGTSVSELIKLADESLYESKKGGRNRVRLHEGVSIGGDPGIGAEVTA